MRRPRLRFTVRWIMVAVAVLALILGGSLEAIRLKRCRDECLKRAAAHAESERVYLSMEQYSRKFAESAESILATQQQRSASLGGGKLEERLRGMSLRTRTIIPESEQTHAKILEQQKRMAAEERGEEARFAESAAYHAALKRKYLRAAARPWQSVEPDPPPPELEARGFYWSERGEYQQALAAYEEALREDPENAGALNGLAWLLATCPAADVRDGKRAIELATRACGTRTFVFEFVDTLAAAHAEGGDFQTAVEVQRKAIGMLPPGDPNAESYRGRLDGYRANKPYRQMVNRTE